MIAIPRKPKPKLTTKDQELFVAMLPTITRVAKQAFSSLDPEAKGEATAEVVAAAFVMFVGLIERGKVALAYPSVLAMYGVKRVKIGRKAATPLNVRDVSSEYSQLAKGFSLQRLDRFDEEENAWREVVVEDRNVGPAEVACCRIDFEDWIRRLPPRDWKIARFLAAGHGTTDTARRFGVSAGRISQKRKEYLHSWQSFQSEDSPAENRAVALPA